MAVTSYDQWYEEEKYRRLKGQMYCQQQAMIHPYQASGMAAAYGDVRNQQSTNLSTPATPQPDKRLLLLEDTP